MQYISTALLAALVVFLMYRAAKSIKTGGA